MPSVSKKQHNFMEAIAHSKEFAKKVGVPQSVGKDFATADKGKKFKEGGAMKKMKKFAEGDMVEDNSAYVGSRLNMGKDRGSRVGRVSKEDAELIKKQDAESGMNKNPKMGGLASAGAKAGLESMLGKYSGMKKGGSVMEKESKSESKKEMAMDKKQDVAMIKKAFKQHDKQEHKGGKGTTLKLSSGGSFRSSANGIAQRGLTKGKMVTMCGGGMMKKGK
jgi:hypothetical protein